MDAGVHLAVRYGGAPEAPPVLLLHGMGEGARSWSALLPVLGVTHRVIAPDLRGHGASDRPGTYSFELLRDDVLTLLDRLGVGPLAVIGHSMGGMVAALVAEKAPELVSRLVLEDVAPIRPGSWTRPIRERPPGELPLDWALVEQLHPQMVDPDPAWWDDAAAITVPTLLVAGGPTSTFSQDEIRALAARMPDARLVTIPVGHDVHEDAPDRFAAVVTEFLAG